MPAADADNPVPQERVAELLRAVSTDGSGTFSVSTSGRWRSGVLSGQWRKSTAEFIGAGARHAARQRRIAELEDELERLNADIAAAEQRHREAGEHALALERHLDSYPDDNELLTAHVQLASAVDAAEAAEQQAAELREQHEQARQRWQAAHADLVRAAGEAGLPAETQLLQAANRAANDALTCLDLLREAANCSQLRRNFAPETGRGDLLMVPEVVWVYCASTVFTMQRMHGIPVSQVERLRADTDHDRVFTAEAAREYGLIDLVIEERQSTAT